MSLIGWILLGLLAGLIAKGILPKTPGGSWLVMLALGVGGALVGGFLGSALFNAPLSSSFSVQTWLLAVSGAIVLLLIYGIATRGSRNS